MKQTAEEQIDALAFLHEIFRGLEGFCELRSFTPADGRAHQEFLPLPLKNLPRLDEDRDHYFGPAPRVRRSGKDADIARTGALWGDVDGKAFEGGKEEALDLLTDWGPLTPSALVDSGHGLHAYWLLVEPLDAREARGLMEALRYAINPKLDRVENPSRILRVPGTWNLKNGECLPVRLVHWQPQRRFSAEEFAELLDVAGATECLSGGTVTQADKGAIPQEQLDAADPVLLALTMQIPEGGGDTPFDGRNNAATIVAGYFVRVIGEPERAQAAFLAWNQSNCKPPLPRQEAEKVFRSIARRDAILSGKPPPEGERDIAPEDDEERQLMLQALRDRFGIPLDDITRIGGSNPVYRFVCAGSMVSIPARRLENQGNFRRAMIEATERVPAKIGSKANPGWDHYLQQMLNVARRMDPGEEAYERGQLKAWVGRYLEINDIRDAAEPTDIPEMPCRSDGRVCLHLEGFRRFVEVEFGVTPNAMELAQKLTAEGFERNTLNVKLGGGGRTTRSMWAVPEEWEGEY